MDDTERELARLRRIELAARELWKCDAPMHDKLPALVAALGGEPGGPQDLSQLSDGYHTFAELYEHRHVLFTVLCAHLAIREGVVWRARFHVDGTMFPGWFVAGIDDRAGRQITYHLPDRLWTKFQFAETRDTAPPWDGHTPDMVIERLWKLLERFGWDGKS